MAWTSPMTAVANSVFTAAQFNTNVRDNLNTTAPALATAAGQHFVSTAVNTIIQRTSSTATVATQESTTSTSYTDLATAGPDLTSQQTGTKVLVCITGAISNDTANSYAIMGYGVSGASTIAGADSNSLQLRAGAANQQARMTACVLETGLTAGSNSWRGKYRASANTASFANRNLVVIPFS